MAERILVVEDEEPILKIIVIHRGIAFGMHSPVLKIAAPHTLEMLVRLSLWNAFIAGEAAIVLAPYHIFRFSEVSGHSSVFLSSAYCFPNTFAALPE